MYKDNDTCYLSNIEIFWFKLQKELYVFHEFPEYIELEAPYYCIDGIMINVIITQRQC